jgi:tetratricopeptide (TPR) repeat protein
MAFRNIRDDRGLAVALGNQASIYVELGIHERAFKLLDEQQQLCQAVGDAALLVPCLGTKAKMFLDRGDLDSAKPLFDKVLALAEETGNGIAYVTTLLNLGKVQQAKSQHDAAEEFFAHASSVSRVIDWPVGIVQALLSQAQLPQIDQARAESLVTEALGVAREHSLSGFDEIAQHTLENRRDNPDERGHHVAQAALDPTRKLYEELQAGAQVWLGPRPGFLPSSASEVADIRIRLGFALGEVTEIGRNVYQCPSPWHAAIKLLALQDRSLSENVIDRQTMVFRGQGDHRWPLVASVDRAGVDAALEVNLLEMFSVVLTRFFEREAPANADFVAIEANTASVHAAAAQHYGIRTHLLDFTADPCVAVAFANQSSAGEMGAVYGASFDLARRNGLAVLLPHPYFFRLYLQRGIFIDTRAGFANDDFRAGCVEVRFPRAEGFAAYRDRVPIELLPVDPFFERIVSELRRITSAPDARPLDVAAADAIIDAAGGLPQTAECERRRQCINEAFLEFWQTLYTLVVLNQPDGSRAFDGGVLCELAKANRPVLRALRRLYGIAMTVISHFEPDYKRDEINDTLAVLVGLFAEAPRSPGRQDMRGRWQLVRDVPDWALSSVVNEFHQNGSRVQIHPGGNGSEGGWFLTCTR